MSRSSHFPVCRIDVLNTEFAPHRPLADKQSPAGGSRWSRAIAERYQLRLSAELDDWFDSGACEALGHGEFCEPATPDQLLGPAPECIWPGLMPPDVLPLVGNGLGDWLCGRVSAQGTIDEILYWYHGGGDYLPYGAGLAEALLFDTLADRLPGRRQLHAVPAEREASSHQLQVSGTMISWQAPRETTLGLAPATCRRSPRARIFPKISSGGDLETSFLIRSACSSS